MKTKRLAALLLAVITLLSCVPARADGGCWYVGSARELRELSELCSVDSWSVGVTVVLTADIDLEGEEFSPIPIFGGTFDGKGHTILGLSVTSAGSHMGLFRYIAGSGEVKNLTVRGVVAPTGSADYVGGVAGSNLGKINNCAFYGAVNAVSSVGGIAGTNEETGVITGCRSLAELVGEHFVGGVAGQNLGVIEYCDNSGAVNTTDMPVDVELSDLDFENLLTTENVADYTDIGGIAGFSKGVIEACVNSGAVGYEHIGYNVGGIAGRQSGYIHGCSNTGRINGRKEVGGIVGQMEPYMTADLSADTAESLAREMSRLHSLVDTALVNAQGSSDTISATLGSMAESLGDSADDLDYLANKTADLVDGVMGAANDISDRIGYVSERLPDILAYIEASGSAMKLGIDALGRLNRDLAVSDKMNENLYDETDHALLTVTAGTGGEAYLSSASPAAGQTVTVRTRAQAGYALEEIYALDADGGEVTLEATENAGEYAFVMPTLSGDPISDPVNARAKAVVVRVSFAPVLEEHPDALVLSSDCGGVVSAKSANPEAGSSVTVQISPDEGYALGSITAYSSETLTETPLSRADDLGGEYTLVMPALAEGEKLIVRAGFSRVSDGEAVRAALDTLNERSAVLANSLSSIEGDAKLLADELMGGSPNASEVLSLLSDLVTKLSAAGGALGDIVSALGTLSDVLAPYISDAADSVNGDIDTAAARFSDCANLLTLALSEVRACVDYLNGLTDVSFPTLGSEYNAHIDSLCGNLSDMADGLAALNSQLSQAGTQLVSDLRAINDQFNVVMLLAVDAVQGIGDADIEIFRDVSEYDTASTDGRVDGCVNRGDVFGDINSGGIAGAMAIEYDFDPESDVTASSATAARAYLTKCVTSSCSNYGAVTSKKNGAGGVAGYTDIGMIIDCRGFGEIKSQSGSYVGGIAGDCRTVINSSWAVCSLSGESYVGGIAGYGARIYDCRSLVEISGASERFGAIAGDRDASGELSGNYFVSDTLRGVDGISYSGRAESVSFAVLSSQEGSPGELTEMTLTFTADGEIVKTVPFTYGSGISEDDVPAVPEKEGFFGSWEEFDRERLTASRTVEARYEAYLTALEGSVRKGEANRAALVVEGSFTPDAVLGDETVSDAPSLGDSLTVVETLTASISGNVSGSTSHTVHYLLPRSGLELYVKDDAGDWRRVSYATTGSYAVFDVEGDSFSVCSAERETTDASAVIIIAAVAAAAIAAVLIIRHAKKKKKVKAQ